LSATADISRLRKLGQLLCSPSDTWLTLRMTGWALLLPVAKHIVALPKLARFMWRQAEDASRAGELDRIVRLSAVAARCLPLAGQDNCLERSLITYRYLSGVGLNPHLVVAVRTADLASHGHAWVTVNGEPLAGEDVSMFTPVLEIGGRGVPISTG